MSATGSRSVFVFAALVCGLAMGVALYLEYVVELEPCPLCLIQRGCVVLFGGGCLLAGFHQPRLTGQRIYAVLGLLIAVLGGLAASRQIWLQTLPPEASPDCLPAMDFMLELLPIEELFAQVVQGTARCAEVNWTLLGLSLPEWALVMFMLMAGFCLWLMSWRPRS